MTGTGAVRMGRHGVSLLALGMAFLSASVVHAQPAAGGAAAPGAPAQPPAVGAAAPGAPAQPPAVGAAAPGAPAQPAAGQPTPPAEPAPAASVGTQASVGATPSDVVVPPPSDTMGPDEPLAGFNDGTAFIRSPDNNFILLPNGRLQVDGYGFVRPTDNMPVNTLLLRRARFELGGWIGKIVYFNLGADFAVGAPAGADPVAQSWLNATDDYVALAPFKDKVIVQVGQYDAPFTLENRTSDKYFDFMERSLTVRAFGIPTNKEAGVMVHGMPLDNKGIYYSLGVFNGDGQNFKNVDNNFDVMGRAWVAPFAFTDLEAVKKVTLGGSFWVGKRGATGLAFAPQATQGGFKFLDSKWNITQTQMKPDGTMATTTTPAEMHQIGNLTAFALEADVPISNKFGLRFEYVRKLQDLEEDDITGTAGGKLAALGHAKLDAYSFYGEVWGWLIGDNRIIGDPGLQLPPRLKKLKTAEPRHGLMIAARIDNLQETVTTDTPALKNPNVGVTHIIAPELGINYWYSKRFRATFNYVLNVLGGDTANVAKAKTNNGNGSVEQELQFRLGIAL